LGVLCEAGVGSEIDVVVLVEDPHRSLQLELAHHQFNDV